MTALSTSLSFSFSDDSTSGEELSIENYQQVSVGLGSLAVAVTDTMTVGNRRLYATAGTIQDVNLVVEKTVKAQFIQVDGSAEVTIPAEATYELLFAINFNGEPMSEVMERSRIKNTVRFSASFFGLIKVSEYKTPVHIYKYTPGSKVTNSLVSTAFGVTVTYGTVAVYRNGKLAICDIEPPTVSDGNDELEVYRIESQVLLNDKGEWELPDGWPDNPTYPSGATPPRPRVGVVSTRVHEVGMVTSEGYFYSRSFDVAVQKPYFGLSYAPKKVLVAGSGLSKLTPAMQIKAQEAMRTRGKSMT